MLLVGEGADGAGAVGLVGEGAAELDDVLLVGEGADGAGAEGLVGEGADGAGAVAGSLPKSIMAFHRLDTSGLSGRFAGSS